MLKKSKALQYIKNKAWYHQGFDGAPMFLFAVGEAETKIEKRKPKGTEARFRVCFYSDGVADWYLDMEDVKRGAKVIVDLAKKDAKISDKLLKAWKEDEKAFERFFWKESPKLNLKKLSDDELIKLWNHYYNLFTTKFTSSCIIDHFALGTDVFISEMIKSEIKESLRDSEYAEIFAIATAPVKQSFINQAEIDLLKIVTKKSKQSLKDYQKKYFWINNNYAVAKNLTVTHFQKEISAWKTSKKNLEKELDKIEQTPVKNKKAKEKLFKKYKFSKHLKTLIKVSEDLTWWQDERKKSTFLNIHLGMKFLKEVGKRTGYKPENLKYAVAKEIEGIMKKQKPSEKELAKRRKASLFVVDKTGYFVASGKQAEELKKVMLGNKKVDETQDIRGLVASVGRAIGKVKVLRSATEVNKIKKGDVLVAVMTRPDYVQAMKKASAIVTDEGGVTSHAAIVSRELGVPCIIGTKIATKVFKDGDKVEVNANHGWVRKIDG